MAQIDLSELPCYFQPQHHWVITFSSIGDVDVTGLHTHLALSKQDDRVCVDSYITQEIKPTVSIPVNYTQGVPAQFTISRVSHSGTITNQYGYSCIFAPRMDGVFIGVLLNLLDTSHATLTHPISVPFNTIWLLANRSNELQHILITKTVLKDQELVDIVDVADLSLHYTVPQVLTTGSVDTTPADQLSCRHRGDR